MARLKLLTICIFLLCLSLSKSFQPSRNDINDLRRKFIEINDEVWSVIRAEKDANAPHTQSKKIALEKYKEFAEELERIIPNKHLSDGLSDLNQNRLWMSIYSDLRQIYTLYENNFKKIIFLENIVPSPEEQWMEFSTTILDNFNNYKYLKSTVPYLMKKLSDYVDGRNLFLNIYLDIVYRPCELGQSNNQIIYNLYSSVALTQLKAFVMSQFAYSIFEINDKGKSSDALKNREEFNKYFKKATESIKNTLKIASNEITKCDPQQYIKEETYTEITELLQGYLENEVDMNPRSNCLQNCDYYDYTNHMGCYRGICKNQKICKGKIVECKYIASDMTVCEAEKSSGKRYEYIEYDNNRVFGRNTGCKGKTSRVESWWRWLFWHCSYCICLCDDAHPKSDRYFSLKPVVSDVSSNMVVTGVRFRKINRVIYLQIREARLMPYGNVNSSLSRWKPIESIDVNNKYVRPGDDYHTLSYENRDLDLDDLNLEDGYLVTGFKFRVVGTHLNLEIKATPFNYTTGYLIQPNIKSFWHSSDETLNRKKLDLKNPDLPIRTTSPSKVDSKHNMYLEFQNSDLERDVGQSTIPFIDTQDVTSDVQVPLSGAGIYHKGQPNFGGFIAPKIMTYNNTAHILF